MSTDFPPTFEKKRHDQPARGLLSSLFGLTLERDQFIMNAEKVMDMFLKTWICFEESDLQPDDPETAYLRPKKASLDIEEVEDIDGDVNSSFISSGKPQNFAVRTASMKACEVLDLCARDLKDNFAEIDRVNSRTSVYAVSSTRSLSSVIGKIIPRLIANIHEALSIESALEPFAKGSRLLLVLLLLLFFIIFHDMVMNHSSLVPNERTTQRTDAQCGEKKNSQTILGG
uniref:Uncharacterized protein n=1 Tax=Glossina austeni TaxID=7395 RepID=A0A1A9UHJ3_GLOAU